MMVLESAVDYEYPGKSIVSDSELLALLEARLRAGESERLVLRNLDYRTQVLCESISEYLSFAFECGLPLAPVVTWLRLEFGRQAGQKRKAEKAMRAPALTAQLVNWAPWATLLMAQAFGIPAVSVLVSGVAGWAVIAGSAILGLVGSRASLAIARRAATMPHDWSLQYQLLSLASEMGLGLRLAHSQLRSRVKEVDPNLDSWCLNALSQSLPVVSLLNQKAQQLRDEYQHQLDLKVEALPLRLMYPMAAFVIPQFLLLLVAPQILAAIGLINK